MAQTFGCSMRFLVAFALAVTATATSAFDGGAVIEVLPDGTQVLEQVLVRDKVFKWKRAAPTGSPPNSKGSAGAMPTRAGDDGTQPSSTADIQSTLAQMAEEMSDAELGQLSGSVMLRDGQEYVEQVVDPEEKGKKLRVQLDSFIKSASGGGSSSSGSMPTSASASMSSLLPRPVKPFPSEHQGMPFYLNTTAIDTELVAAMMLNKSQVEDPHGKKNSPSARKLLGGIPSPECDDFRELRDNTLWPHNSQVMLGYADYPSANAMKTVECSATLIGTSTAISAASCFWNNLGGFWYETYHWAPGYDQLDEDPSPFGMWKGCYSVFVPGIYLLSEFSHLAHMYDYAVMTFEDCLSPTRNGVDPDSPGDGHSLAGVYANPPESMFNIMFNRGYPRQLDTCGATDAFCGKRLYGDHGTYSQDLVTHLLFESITISPTHRGSAVYAYWALTGMPYAVCITQSAKLCGDTQASEEMRCRLIDDTVDEFIKLYSSDF